MPSDRENFEYLRDEFEKATREELAAHERAIKEIWRELARLQADRETNARFARAMSSQRGDGSRAQRRGAR